MFFLGQNANRYYAGIHVSIILLAGIRYNLISSRSPVLERGSADGGVMHLKNAMITILVAAINEARKEIIGGQAGTTQKKDANGSPTGEIENYFKVSVEIPKGYGALSKCQFDVKIPGAVQTFSEKDIQENEYYVSFEGLEVSYIDNRNVYLRATSYKVIEPVEV